MSNQSLLPLPALPITVRPATRADIPFIDALQKKYSKALGFFPRAQLEGYIDNGWALLAVGTTRASPAAGEASHAPKNEPLGYLLSRDRYLKRDELGVIYQLCVSPVAQRGLIGASLVKAAFERSAYGCRLYCCWCAQDLQANKFWEALGFVALAFRSGGGGKIATERRNDVEGTSDAAPKGRSDEGMETSSLSVASSLRRSVALPRIHIFWQKRIRDNTTPWWYPSETGGGAIRENRLVLPIPPGMHWSDAKPMLLPGVTDSVGRQAVGGLSAVVKPKQELRDNRTAVTTSSSLSRPMFLAPGSSKAPRPKSAKRVARRNDPALVARARALRDRWLEEINADGPQWIAGGKYDLRGIETQATQGAGDRLLEGDIIDVTPIKMLAA